MLTNDNRVEFLRERLNRLIANEAPYEQILKASQKLDVLIAKVMSTQLPNNKHYVA